jgi:hypothetical protein
MDLQILSFSMVGSSYHVVRLKPKSFLSGQRALTPELLQLLNSCNSFP